MRAELARLQRMAEEKGTVHDPRVLRAIAHPVRNRILTELSAGRTDAGRRHRRGARASRPTRPASTCASSPSTASSWRRRRRPATSATASGRSADDGGLSIDVGALEKQPGGKAAATVFLRNAAGYAHQLVEAAYGQDRAPETHRSTMDTAVRLTKDEAAQLATEVAELVQRWTERNRGRDRRPHDVRLPRDAAAPARRRRRRRRGRRLMPARLKVLTPEQLADAPTRKALVKHYLAVLEQRAPGRSVEVRVPPYAAVQVVPGRPPHPRHAAGRRRDRRRDLARGRDRSYDLARGGRQRQGRRQRRAHRPLGLPPARRPGLASAPCT